MNYRWLTVSRQGRGSQLLEPLAQLSRWRCTRIALLACDPANLGPAFLGQAGDNGRCCLLADCNSADRTAGFHRGLKMALKIRLEAVSQRR